MTIVNLIIKILSEMLIKLIIIFIFRKSESEKSKLYELIIYIFFRFFNFKEMNETNFE